MPRLPPAAIALAGLLAASHRASADPSVGWSSRWLVGPEPPRLVNDSYQYGVSLLALGIVGRGDLCGAAPRAPCIIGPGGGATIRVGYRGGGAWFFGGAYEFAKLDAGNLYRLAILQTARAEARLLLAPEARFSPYGVVGFGASAYGNEWGADSGGAAAAIGVGVEGQLSRTSLLGAALTYRPVLLNGWTDGSGAARPTSVVSFVGLELVIEQRSPTRY